jgi:hypothetical protein
MTGRVPVIKVDWAAEFSRLNATNNDDTETMRCKGPAYKNTTLIRWATNDNVAAYECVRCRDTEIPSLAPTLVGAEELGIL